MTSPSFVLSVRYTPVGVRGGVGKRASGFLRYVQYRDHHEDWTNVKDVDGMLRYVGHRDQATARGRVFDAHGTAGDEERRQLTQEIRRSVRDLNAWHRQGPDRRRAFYQLVLSPREAQGLDLRRLTRAAMAQLGRDAGTGSLPRWIAAEHRNTRHPHVHVVLAARREVSPGQFRTLQITPERLARMKVAVDRELELERSHNQERRQGLAQAISGAAIELAKDSQREHGPQRQAWLHERGQAQVETLILMHARRHQRPSLSVALSNLAGRTARRYRLEAERLARERGYRSRMEEEQELRRSYGRER